MVTEKMMDAFIDGVAKGIGYTLGALALALILLLLMFAPESKTKTVTEPPCAVMIYSNI